jgi:group I intron endonuclease
MHTSNDGSGVYMILNTVSKMIYIGSTKNFRRRCNGHRYELNNGKHRSRHLQNSWNKYGQDAFEFLVLEHIWTPSDLLGREQWWIDYLRAAKRGRGYNLAPVAGSTLGFKFSDAMRANLSAIRKGKPRSPEWRKNIGDANRGRPRKPITEETRAKMSASSTGRRHTEEAKAKCGAANKGRTRTEEVRQRIAATLRARHGGSRETGQECA